MSFWTKQRATKKPTEHGENMIELEIECILPQFSTELLMLVFITSITDRKLRENLPKEKDFGVPNVVEQIQRKTYDRKNEKKRTRISNIKPRKKSKKNLYTKEHIPENTQRSRKRDQKNETADIAINHNRILTKFAQPVNRYVITAKKLHFAKAFRIE